jgi:hypothetical protein
MRRLYPAGRGCPQGPPNPDAVKRLLYILALGSLALLSACKDQPQGANAPNALVQPASDIVVKSVRILAAPENSVQGNTLYVVSFTFTNDVGRDLVPQLNHFTFEDANKVRHTGIDSGSTALAGLLHNSDELLKKGESRDYTAAFLVNQGAYGTLYYALDF